jgi:phage terminase small subunit
VNNGIETLRDRIDRILNNPQLTEQICGHVSSGGTLVDLASMWQIPFAVVSNWISTNPEAFSAYSKAVNIRNEWAVDKVLSEVARIAFVDIREAFNDDGSLKKINDMPANVASAIASIEVDELWAGYGKEREQIGVTKRIKFWNKEKMLELYGKQFKMFMEHHAVSGHLSLEDLIVSSYKKEE